MYMVRCSVYYQNKMHKLLVHFVQMFSWQRFMHSSVSRRTSNKVFILTTRWHCVCCNASCYCFVTCVANKCDSTWWSGYEIGLSANISGLWFKLLVSFKGDRQTSHQILPVSTSRPIVLAVWWNRKLTCSADSYQWKFTIEVKWSANGRSVIWADLLPVIIKTHSVTISLLGLRSSILVVITACRFLLLW